MEHMEEITRALEAATWAAVEGEASDQQLGLLEADPVGWKLALERLIDATEDGLDEAEQLTGPERPQVIADFEEELDRLFAAYDLLLATKDTGAIAHAAAEPPGVVRLQASWTAGDVVLWAAGPNTMPANRAELTERLEAIGGPSLGGVEHPGVTLPTGARAEARSIPLTEALGWLAAVGGGLGGDEVGASVTWLGQVVLTAVRLVTRGSIVPLLKGERQAGGRSLDLAVRWVPALVDDAELTALAAAMPGPITALHRGDPRSVTLDVLGTVVNAIATDAAGRLELPAPPPVTNTAAAIAEAMVTRLDGSHFEAPLGVAAGVQKRLERWVKPVTGTPTPASWCSSTRPIRATPGSCRCSAPGAEGGLLPIEQALVDSRSTKGLAEAMYRLERVLPVLLRPGRAAPGPGRT